MLITYPSLLRPTAFETLTVAGQPLAVPKVQLHLRRWFGPPLSNTFNSKPLVDLAGQPVFAELATYELFRLSGWEARWVSTFGASATMPKLLTDWLDALPKQQRSHPLPETGPAALLSSIASHNGGTYAGCWDVLGWHGDTVLFAELKRFKKDRLQATQFRWLAAGLQAGLQPENFLLVEWDYLP